MAFEQSGSQMSDNYILGMNDISLFFFFFCNMFVVSLSLILGFVSQLHNILYMFTNHVVRFGSIIDLPHHLLDCMPALWLDGEVIPPPPTSTCPSFPLFLFSLSFLFAILFFVYRTNTYRFTVVVWPCAWISNQERPFHTSIYHKL